MSKTFAWRPLALLPILKASACRETDKDWLVNRRLDLYHCSMDHVIADLNELCSKDIYLCFADNHIRLSRAFLHVLVLDGAADSRPDSGTGSRPFEVNIWMWRYGRAFPRNISAG